MLRQFTLLDHVITNIDTAMRTLFIDDNRATYRPSPAAEVEADTIPAEDKKHVAGLMRVNHTGEVCAQALYQGQALTAKLPDIRDKMTQAAQEEIDHLGWCEQRLKELGANTSILNFPWYCMSLSIGAVAGLAGDKWSLGFVVETEKQVTKHLEFHIKQLPKNDIKSLKVLQNMVIDETSHATTAFNAGGKELPLFIKTLMGLMSKVMTNTSYYI